MKRPKKHTRAQTHVGRHKRIQRRVKDQRQQECGERNVQVVDRVAVVVVGMHIPLPARIHNHCGEQQRQNLGSLVEPVPGAVPGQVSFKGNNGTEPSGQKNNVALHHPTGNASNALYALYLDEDHQEREHRD